MNKACLILEDDGLKLEPKVLSEYLSLFEACVVAASDLEIRLAPEDDVETVRERFHEVTPLGWNSYFDRESSQLISIETISRQSPLSITIACAVGLVTVAVVLSGGKIKIGKEGVEAELPPLGTGIKCLKEALGLGGKIRAGFSIRTITVKLNKVEIDLLMQQDPTQKGKGGFQNFLIGLQSRTNKTTKELTLGDTDLERIMLYKSSPQTGGFQSRFKKIFGRHFPADE